jgi:hypothetical protein
LAAFQDPLAKVPLYQTLVVALAPFALDAVWAVLALTLEF